MNIRHNRLYFLCMIVFVSGLISFEVKYDRTGYFQQKRIEVSRQLRGMISDHKNNVFAVKLHQISTKAIAEGKKGFAITLRPIGQKGSYVDNLSKILALDVYWNHGWSLDRVDQQPSTAVFVPFVWGGEKNYSAFQTAIDKSNVHEMIQQGNVKYVGGFNEPDMVTQSNMTVAQAIDRWPILESLGVPLISPSCAKPAEKWMRQFMGNVTERKLRVDYTGVHWYGPPEFADFKKNITTYYNMYKRPIVITEFAVADWSAGRIYDNRYTKDEVLYFMHQALPWLEQTPWIAAYSWFSFQPTWGVGWTSSLFDIDGNLNIVGRYYKSVRADNIYGDQTIYR